MVFEAFFLRIFFVSFGPFTYHHNCNICNVTIGEKSNCHERIQLRNRLNRIRNIVIRTIIANILCPLMFRWLLLCLLLLLEQSSHTQRIDYENKNRQMKMAHEWSKKWIEPTRKSERDNEEEEEEEAKRKMQKRTNESRSFLLANGVECEYATMNHRKSVKKRTGIKWQFQLKMCAFYWINFLKLHTVFFFILFFLFSFVLCCFFFLSFHLCLFVRILCVSMCMCMLYVMWLRLVLCMWFSCDFLV